MKRERMLQRDGINGAFEWRYGIFDGVLDMC